MCEGWLHKVNLWKRRNWLNSAPSGISVTLWLSCWGRCWAGALLFQGNIKKQMKKEANLPSIVRASRHGKSYFVAALAGINRKKQQSPSGFIDNSGEGNCLDGVAFFVSISRIDWRRRCAGTCLQGKRKFRSEGMISREQHRKGIPLLILLFSFTSDILEVFMLGIFVHGPVLNPMCAKWSRRGADQSQRIKSTHGAFGGALSAETTFCAFAVCTEVTWKS